MIPVPSVNDTEKLELLYWALVQQVRFEIKAALFPVRGAKRFIEVYGEHQLHISLDGPHYHVAFEATPMQVALQIPQKDFAGDVPKLMEWVTKIHELTQIKPEKVEMQFD